MKLQKQYTNIKKFYLILVCLHLHEGYCFSAVHYILRASISKGAAVLWLKIFRHGIKHYAINQLFLFLSAKCITRTFIHLDSIRALLLLQQNVWRTVIPIFLKKNAFFIRYPGVPDIS